MADDELDQDVEEPIFDQDTEAQDVEEPEPEHTLPDRDRSEKEFKKLQAENKSLRGRLRRTEIEARYGKDIADLIPGSLPMREWLEFAEKVRDRIAEESTAGRFAQTGQSVEEVSNPEPTAEERNLALAAAAGTSGYHDTALEGLSAKEILELGKVSPGAAERLIATQYRGR